MFESDLDEPCPLWYLLIFEQPDWYDEPELNGSFFVALRKEAMLGLVLAIGEGASLVLPNVVFSCPDGFGAVFFEVRDAGLDLIFAEIAGFCDFEDIGFSPAWDMMVWKDETAKVAWCHDRGL